MKKVLFLFSVLLVLKVSSQEVEKTNDDNILPASIYTSSLNKLPSINSILPIDKKEDLSSFEDISLNVASIKKEIATIFSENLGRQSTKFFNETFQERIMNKVITSAFFDLDALYNLPRENPKNDIN